MLAHIAIQPPISVQLTQLGLWIYKWGGQGGDFDGDGDEDVIVIAGIGDRPFLALGSDEDKSYWSTIHLYGTMVLGDYLRIFKIRWE